MKALQLCSCFALQPNSLGYCGRDSAPAKLSQCIIKGECDGVIEELEQFIVLNPYLQTISEITGHDPFSYEVIEAYWLGNDLLNQIKTQHYDLLVKNLADNGVPDFLIEEIQNKKPKQFIPIHLFNILHVGVGKASGSVPFNLDSINNCMVRWGKVRSMKQVVSGKGSEQKYMNLRIKELKNSSTKQIIQNTQLPATSYQLLTVETVKLIQQGNQYKLEESREEKPFLAELVGDLKIGDTVALHWGWIAKKLTEEEQNKLTNWTQKLIDSIKLE